VIRTQLDRKVEPPKWFFDKPELLPGQEFYIDSFDQLTSCRQLVSGAVGRIPWTALVEYAEVYGLSWPDLLLFQYILSQMDTYYIEWVHNEIKSGD
jgi:hypothetical protein